MDVKEKLVEILRKPIFPHELADPVEAVADYLLDSGATVQELDGCEYCNAFTEEDINGFFLPTTDPDCECAMVTIKFCPMCGRRLPQPPKGE